MSPGNKIFFASDFHLGAPNQAASLERERSIVRWLNSIEAEVRELYLLGDLFDFWFEYKHAVPKGHIRLLGKLADFADRGIPIHIFTGNHDLWMNGYLEAELNAQVYHAPIIRDIDGKQFYLAHGDGLGPGDQGFKLMKKVFTNPFSQWLYARIHPNTGIAMANFFSRRSRAATGSKDAFFLGEDKEWLMLHSKEILKSRHIDYFVYGHRHMPVDLPLPGGSRYINLGDWIHYNSYGVWDGQNFSLNFFEKEPVRLP